MTERSVTASRSNIELPARRLKASYASSSSSANSRTSSRTSIQVKKSVSASQEVDGFDDQVCRLKRKTPLQEKIFDEYALLKAVKANYRFVYRINDGVGTVNTILQQVCEERGWREFQEPTLFNTGTSHDRAVKCATGWNLWWSYSIYQFSPYKYLRQWQFTNHNPKGFQFCNKLYLTMYMRKMKAIHGSIYDFYPQTFIVPDEYARLSLEHARRARDSVSTNEFNNLLNEEPKRMLRPPDTATTAASRNRCRTLGNSQLKKRPQSTPASNTTDLLVKDIQFCPVWISKPAAQSQGKGIYLTTELMSIVPSKKIIVQEYITRPHLIGGYKWDLRIYVCVAAIDPLVVYIYNEGLCRFCTEKYDTSDLAAIYSHLTNASLNKLSPAYEKDKELIGHGCKWSLRKLRKYFQDKNIPDWLLWQKVMAMVVLAVIGDSLRLGYSASNRNCFDLFGFDVLIDQDLKPWLLECNYSPGLGGDCKIDEIVKKPMLHELFNLLGFPHKDTEKKSLGNEFVQGGGENASTTFEAPLSKDDVTQYYFDLMLNKMRSINFNGKKKQDSKNLDDIFPYSAEARLKDARTIYSQNLVVVVQYLRNQSLGDGKISKSVREQLIAMASKKLKGKLAEKNSKKENKEPASKKVRPHSAISKEEEAKIDSTSTSGSASVPQPLLNEPFEKLKNYFSYFEGVHEYQLNANGKFKNCPALLSIKNDWLNPPKQEGGWVRVYPFDARSSKSPYRSSLTDIRHAVRSLEHYMKIAEEVFRTDSHCSDEKLARKMNALCRRDTLVWTPPPPRRVNDESAVTPAPSSSTVNHASSDQDSNNECEDNDEVVILEN